MVVFLWFVFLWFIFLGPLSRCDQLFKNHAAAGSYSPGAPYVLHKDTGGADTLIDMDADGVTLKGRWGAWINHKVWYLVEADDSGAITRFLDPGMKHCTAIVEPVGEAPVQR